MKRLTKRERAKAEAALLTAAQTQDLFWKFLGQLEDAIGCEVDGTQDLRDASVKELRRKGNKR